MTEHDEGPRPPFDPFENHLRFVTTPGGETLYPVRAPLSMFQPMEAGSVHMIDPEALEARRSWQGSVAVHREREPSDYPSEMTDAMQVCEPQFILRNLGRVERWGDPDEALALEALEKLDPDHLYQVVTGNEISMCGLRPAVIVLECLKQLGQLSGCQQVGYATSADVSGDTSRVVGYAGVTFQA